MDTGFAKINLTLHVTGQRENGYHELDSLVVFANQGDDICLDTSLTSGQFIIEGPFADQLYDVPSSENLVIRARDAYLQALFPDVSASETSTSLPGIKLIKNLPVASGIGGGSADAAAMLRLLNTYYDHPFELSELCHLALEIGADLPICLISNTARMQGIGETITELDGLPPFSIVLVNPGTGVATSDVFKALTEKNNPPMQDPGEYIQSNQSNETTQDISTFLDYLSRQRNDLEKVATLFVPAISDVLAALEKIDTCQLARMSGSGATCFGIFARYSEATAAAALLREQHSEWWIKPAKIRSI